MSDGLLTAFLAGLRSQKRWRVCCREQRRAGGHNSGELEAKLKLGERRLQASLKLTRDAGSFYPRLEGLVEQLQLSPFEKSVILYLAGSMISPIFKQAVGDDRYSYGPNVTTTVGQLLSVFCTTISEQVAARVFFYKTAALVKKALVRVTRMRGAADLTDMQIQLDRRVLDCIVGLDKESSEVAEGSHLYEPRVSISAVVLPPQLKDTITEAVSHFDCFRKYRKRTNFDAAIQYGTGLVLMFCGPSGTGKTLTANAIAAMLSKKLNHNRRRAMLAWTRMACLMTSPHIEMTLGAPHDTQHTHPTHT